MYAAMMSLGAVLVMLIATGAMVSGQQQIWFTLESTDPIITTDNTEILITDIGEGAVGGLPRLTCHTDLTTCCRSKADNNGMGPLGQWTYPNGSVILRNDASGAAGQQFYTNRNDAQLIRLSRRQGNNPVTPTGSYCCTVPTTGGVEMTLCANLVLCPSLTLMDGVISYSDLTLGSDTVATHTCEAGSALTTDLTTRTCGVIRNGVRDWSGSPLVCVGSACPDLTDLQNGVISYNTVSANDYRRVTTVATYTCDTGFTLTGTSMRTCSVSGWEGTAPTCTDVVNCGDLTDPSNGAVVTFSGTTFMMTATYTCNTGYTLTGDTTRMCGAGGSWTLMEPTCAVVDCGSLGAPSNGMIGVPTTTFGSTAMYACNTGYTLTGHTTRTCQANGVWTFSAPICNLSSITATVTSSGPPMAGQSYTLTCTVTGGESLNPTIMYEWTRGGTLVAGSDIALTFNPLTLSSSGQYVCTVTVTSDLLTTTLTDASDTFEVTIKVPPPSVSLSPPPTGVFTGQSVELSCTILLDSSVDTSLTVTVQWFNSTSAIIDTTIATLQSPPLTYQTTTTLSVFMPGDTGTYSCAAVVTSSRPLTTPSESVSASAAVSLTPVPSAPVITAIAGTTSLSFSWTQPEGDIVSHYVIATSYVGDCPEIGNAFPGVSSPNFPDTALDLSEIFVLQEYSDYSLSVSAVNDAGSSESSTLVATTLSTPPSGSVQNLMATLTPSTVIVQWDRVTCIDRNSEIIGYRVTFGPTSTSARTTETVPGTDMRTFTASGLIPRTQYTFTVIPFSASDDGSSDGVIMETTTLPTEVMFQLGGQFYSSHSILDPSTISTGLFDSLLCVTNTMACCQDNEGQWFFPDETEISTSSIQPHYISRGISVVRLNRRSSATTPAGVYRCEVPASSGTESVYIGLYPPGQGTPTIPGGIQFNRADLTLTCVSNGGPASEVVWTRDGATVSTGYTLTQTATNTASATYDNILTATTITDLVGTFTCTVSNIKGTDTADIILNGVQILGDSPPFTVGSTATLSCVSDSDATMIEWFDGSGTRVDMTTTGRTLDYVLDPVTDDLHQTTFTCRVTRNNGVGEQSITLSVIVPDGAISIATSVSGTATAGEVYSLICSISEVISGLTGVPQAVWTGFDGNVMTGNDIIVTSSDGMSTLTFNPLKITDGGMYTCTGSLQSPPLSNPLTVVESRPVIVTIPTPGVTLTTPPSPITAGYPLTLTCTITVDNAAVDLNVVVDIVWEISTDTTPITITSTASGSVVDTLTIPIFSTRYTGVTCRASVRRPSDDPFVITSSQGLASVDITVRVEIPPPPVVTITVSGDSMAGSSLSLLCTATPPIPLVIPPTVSWIQQDLADTVTPVTFYPSASVTLTFNPLRTSRGGVYVCVAGYNIPAADLPDLSNNASTIVSVQIPRPDARITSDPMMDGYTVGLFLTLVCEVTLSPAVDTMVNLDPVWRREGIVLTTRDQLTVGPFKNLTKTNTNDDQKFTSLLEFQPLTRYFIGNDTLYECVASVVPQSDTFITGTTTNTSTTLTVGDADFAASISSDSTVLAGSEHTLVCQGDRGDDQADGTTLEVEWFNPDGVLITGETSDVMITGVTDITTDPTLISSLIFPSLQTSQAGPYTCRVNHTIPDTTITDQSILSSSVVTVQIPPPTVSVSSPTPVYHGTSHTLSCNAGYDTSVVTTAVTLDYSWTGPRDKASSDSVALTLSPVDLPAQRYTCTVTVRPTSISAFINNGSDSATNNLTVLGAPPPEVLTGVPVREERCGQVSSITCSASVIDNFVATPTFMWRGPGGDIVDSDNILNLASVMTGGEYTCMACVNVPQVNIINLCTNSTITIQNTNPQPVSDVMCSSLSPSTLSVSWSPPTDPVLSYQVEVKQYSLVEGTVNTFDLFDRENIIATTTVEGLAASTRYLVSVEAVSGVGCSDVTEIDCYTEQTQPPVVTGVTVNRIDGTAMNVSWTPLNKAQSNGFIQSYIVTYSVVTATPNRKRQGSQQVTVSSDKNGTIIGGLDPGSEYSVGVRASGEGGTSQSSPPIVSPTITSVLFQLRLTNIPSCPDWVDQDGRIEAVMSTFAVEVESHCRCGFSSVVLISPVFRCFPESSTAVTFRATLTDSRLLTPIQDWIQTNGFIPIQSVLIEVDKSCQVEITSLADTECSTILDSGESSAAVIGGVVGGVVIVLIVAVTITVIVIAVLVFKSRRDRSQNNKGVVSTGEIQPYEMIEMGDHEYEEISKFQQFQQPSGGEYEMVGGPSAGYENRAAIMATKQTSPPPPPPPQPSQQEDFEVTECIAYSTTTHGPPILSPMAPLPLTLPVETH